MTGHTEPHARSWIPLPSPAAHISHREGLGSSLPAYASPASSVLLPLALAIAALLKLLPRAPRALLLRIGPASASLSCSPPPPPHALSFPSRRHRTPCLLPRKLPPPPKTPP